MPHRARLHTTPLWARREHMCRDDIEPMLVEGDERKASAGHVRLLKAERFGRVSFAGCLIKPDLRD